MKKYLLLLTCLSLLATSQLFAQTTIEKYCFLKCFNNLGNDNTTKIELTFGKTDSLFTFTDSTIIPRLKRVESFRNISDAFNYLGTLGWEVAIPSFPAVSGLRDCVMFCFHKKFTPAELRKDR